jgi:hypothetical protein
MQVGTIPTYLMVRISGRVYFVGDYTHNYALDGVAWSGVRAADQVIEAALAIKKK